MMLQVAKGLIVDHDAVRIGERYAQGNLSLVDFLRSRWDCGVWLSEKKTTVPKWYAWVEDNATVLGFGKETARKLMKFAKDHPTLAWGKLSEKQRRELTAELWGHGDARFAHCTGDIEWFTPPNIVAAARAVMGSIDIDPASCAQANQVVKAKQFFTKETDGLKHAWPGNVFINPPFTNPIIRNFAEQLVDQFLSGVTRNAVWISNASTDAAWWHDLVQRGIVCILRKRIKWWGPEGEKQTSVLGQNIIYLGDRRDSFCQEFAEIGRVMEPVNYERAD